MVVQVQINLQFLDLTAKYYVKLCIIAVAVNFSIMLKNIQHPFYRLFSTLESTNPKYDTVFSVSDTIHVNATMDLLENSVENYLPCM